MCLTVAERNRLEILRNNQQQRKSEDPEAQTPATVVDAPVAVDASPAEPLAPPPVSTDLGFLKGAPKALADDGIGVVEVSLPSKIASEGQKITQAVSEVISPPPPPPPPPSRARHYLSPVTIILFRQDIASHEATIFEIDGVV